VIALELDLAADGQKHGRLNFGSAGCSAQGSGPAAERRHRGSQRLWDLQLLIGPVGTERGQQAGTVAVDAEHDDG
jgi:hypothetical protein